MLTKKQSQVLSFIEGYIDKNGIQPTLKEIAEFLNIKSTSTIHQHIKTLAEKGYLNKSENYSSISIDEPKTNLSEVKIIGSIAAGSPILALEESEPTTLEVSNLPRGSKFYALKVKGDSMIEDGIFDGDTVVIRQQNTAIDGQTVVAIIDKEYATLKKIYKEKSGYRLQPANQTMLPIFTNEVEVQGIVWEIRRSYNSPIATSNKRAYRTIDLFAGIGGIRLGFERAGFETVFSNDFEPACKNTFDLNFDNSKLVVEDVTKINAKELPKFDFLLGGFPCQAFSIAGYRKGFKDDKGRGNLFFDIARILDEKKPMGFLLENVKNLRTHDNGRTFEIIERALEELGYHIKSKVLNSMEYGNVPQNRERIYIVGFKDKKYIDAFKFPEKIPLKKTVLDILEEGPVDEKYLYNGKPLFDRIKNDVNEVGAVYQWRRQYVRKNKKGVCPTLTANMGMGGHNVPIIFDGKHIRKLTPRECARIQGYDDSYKLPTNLPDSKLYKQIGNSVSVPVIERIAKNMHGALAS